MLNPPALAASFVVVWMNGCTWIVAFGLQKCLKMMRADCRMFKRLCLEANKWWECFWLFLFICGVVTYSRGINTCTIYMGNPEIPVGNQMVRAIPFEKLQKIWVLIWGDASVASCSQVKSNCAQYCKQCAKCFVKYCRVYQPQVEHVARNKAVLLCPGLVVTLSVASCSCWS